MERLQELKRLMAHGHCAESVTDVHNTHGSLQKLVRCYFYYIRQCVQKGFPSLDYMRQYLGADAAKWKRRVCLTPSGTRDLTPRAK